MSPVRDSIVRALVEVTGRDGEELRDDSNLKELGVDSMDLLEVGAILEQEYATELDIEDFADARCFGDVVQIFERALTG